MHTTHISLLFLTAFLFGMRHAIDWDHLAAITDIAASNRSVKVGFQQTLFYIIGHSSLVLLFGLVAILFSFSLPSWIDKFMEHFVGVTLIVLGLWIIVTIIKNPKDFRLMSRWQLLFSFVHRIYHKISHEHEVHSHDLNLNRKSTFLIGIIHGVGAETPTQLVLFLTVAGVGGKVLGASIILSFIAGLFVTHILISLLSLFGFAKASKVRPFYLAVGLISGILSLVIGTAFLFARSDILPTISK